jgi:hypothetical protein
MTILLTIRLTPTLCLRRVRKSVVSGGKRLRVVLFNRGSVPLRKIPRNSILLGGEEWMTVVRERRTDRNALTRFIAVKQPECFEME